MKSVFLTGATGLLGRYLLRQLLGMGREVVVLARGGDGISARDRIDDALRYFEEHFQRTLPRPIVVEGRLHEPGLGLSTPDRHLVADHCSTILNCAASIQFQQGKMDDEPYRSNVTGTRQLIEFCRGVGIQDFHHISTAYVCGDRVSRVLEDDFDLGQRFRNDYERSKFIAEQLLRNETCFQSLTIYRPSIIVGDSDTAYSSTFHGFYLPLQLAYLATSSGFFKDRSSYMKAIGLHGTERKNLVPVNWVANVLVHILERRQFHGKTYHLTNPFPLTTAELDSAIAESIRDAIRARPTARPPDSIPATTLDSFREQMQVYAAYLGDDPDFDTQHTQAAAPDLPCPHLDVANLVRMGRFAIDSGFGWPRRRPRPIVLDVGALLQKFPRIDRRQPSQSALRFEVSGSYGGVWEVLFEQPTSLVGIDAGLSGVIDVAGYLNVHTLCDILASKLSVAGAVAAGQLVFEGPLDKISAGPTLMEALCQRLRQSQSNNDGGIPEADLPN